MMRGVLEKVMREEGMVEDVEVWDMIHHLPDNDLAKLETLRGEQQLGEKPP